MAVPVVRNNRVAKLRLRREHNYRNERCDEEHESDDRPDDVVFRVEGNRAVLARMTNILELAGTVAVPAAKCSAPWDEVLGQTRAGRAANRR